ncbi:hypothetical protein JW711_02020 [Candidatus Woesearchaeota archaeon]|nr:hypothetical protein [Candidatus Woesearchaeota archaeon]
MAKAADSLKVRKKKWFQIMAPKAFREVVVGEVPLYESDALKGRKMKINMMNLTHNPRNQSISVKLMVTDVKDGKGVTEVLGFESMPSALKRIVRRGKSKVDDSFVVQTHDKKLVRVKPLVITTNLVANSVKTALRRVVRNNAAKLAAKLTYDKLVEEIMTFKFQKHLQGLCSKITPVRNSEIKAFLLVEKPGVKPIVPGKDIDFRPKDEENFDEEESKEGSSEESESEDSSSEETEEEPKGEDADSADSDAEEIPEDNTDSEGDEDASKKE